VVEDEIEIVELVASSQVIDASANQKCIPWRSTPPFNHLTCYLIPGLKAVFDQSFGNPGAAHLIFFPMLSSGARAN
jgi:hypothetical protein